MDKPKYLNAPIGHVDSLARTLALPTDYLVKIAGKSDSLYNLHKQIEKADGSIREIYSVKYELKTIQRKIISQIYSKISFPTYIKGSIKGSNHITAAKAHVGAKIRINLDISNFFPSLTSDVIFGIWKQFFNFSPSVADLLTKLTTYNGFLPQGAPTSPGLANLAFWNLEFCVVENLQRNGFVYTRYVDDVIVSSKTYTQMPAIEGIINAVFGMFANRKVKPNRKKIDISTSGHKMVIHGLNVSSTVTLPKEERRSITASVRKCELNYESQCQTEMYKHLWESVMGRVNYMNQLHPSEAQFLLERMKKIIPVRAK